MIDHPNSFSTASSEYKIAVRPYNQDLIECIQYSISTFSSFKPLHFDWFDFVAEERLICRLIANKLEEIIQRCVRQFIQCTLWWAFGDFFFMVSSSFSFSSSYNFTQTFITKSGNQIKRGFNGGGRHRVRVRGVTYLFT